MFEAAWLTPWCVTQHHVTPYRVTRYRVTLLSGFANGVSHGWLDYVFQSHSLDGGDRGGAYGGKGRAKALVQGQEAGSAAGYGAGTRSTASPGRADRGAAQRTERRIRARDQASGAEQPVV